MSQDNARKPTQKSRRCYHRVISGLERGGSFRFLTLTSSRQSSHDIHKHFRTLMMRLKRRGLVSGYIQVPEFTKTGLAHKHVILRGKFIAQAALSHDWEEIHGAKIVDIRRIKSRHPHANLAAEMAKYMVKENAFRYSWNWGWVWKGFCRDWLDLKRAWRSLNELYFFTPFEKLLKIWRAFLRLGVRDKLLQFINQCNDSSTTQTSS